MHAAKSIRTAASQPNCIHVLERLQLGEFIKILEGLLDLASGFRLFFIPRALGETMEVSGR